MDQNQQNQLSQQALLQQQQLAQQMRSRMNYNQFNNQVSLQWYQNQQAQNPVLLQRQLQLLQQQQQLQQSQNPILPRLVQSPQIQPQMPVRPVRPVRPQVNPLPPAMFSFCPQQSIRIFGNTPLHGLVDPQQAFFNNMNNSSQVIQPTAWSVPLPDNPITQDKTISAGKKRLHSLLEELDPDHLADLDTEETLLLFADHFINQVTYRASKLAKHANSPFLRVKDICLELEQNWNCRIPGFENPTIPKQRPPNTAHTLRVGTVLKARRDAEIARIAKIAHLNNEAKELQSHAELKEGEDLEVLDEVTVPDGVVVKEEESVNDLNDTPAGTDFDNDNDNEIDGGDTPIVQTPMVDSSVGTPAESLLE